MDEFVYGGDISLIIADSLNQYFGKVSSSEFTQRLLRYANGKSKDGVSIMGDMGSYFFKMKYSELLDYKLSLPTQFNAPQKGLCIYHQVDYDKRLTEKQKQIMVDHHGMAIKLESV